MSIYFENYSGGLKDIEETFDLFDDVVKKTIVPRPPFHLPEVDRVRIFFPKNPSGFLEEVRHVLFESEDIEEINRIEKTLRTLRDNLRSLAAESGIILVLGNDGAEDVAKVNEGKDRFESMFLNVLYFCVEKLAALLTYKHIQIQLAEKK